jgi:protease-4
MLSLNMSNEDLLVETAANTTTHTSARWERDLLERLLLASLKERQAARRWQWFRGFFWLSAMVLLAALFWWGPSAPSGPTGAHTAVVEIRGSIAADADANAQSIVSALRTAFEEPSAQAVVLLIDSPGGSPVQAGIINDEIRRLKSLHAKKVYAVVEETCASAAYYIAVAADEIYADKASLVGSIGVLMDGFGFTGLMDKLGVERRLMTAGKNKGFLDPFSPSSDTQQAFVQAMLDDIHQQFIGVVREGRGDRLKENAETFSGLVWNGQQALEQGLVDGLSNLDAVARDVVKAPELIDYTLREDWSARLAKQIGASIGNSLSLRMTEAGLTLR